MDSKLSDGRTPEDAAIAIPHPQIAAMIRAEGVRRAKCEAFALGQHARLGAGSWVQALDAGVVSMVLEKVR